MLKSQAQFALKYSLEELFCSVDDFCQSFEVFANKGYVSQKLAKQLLKMAGIQLITKLKRNMKQRLMPLKDRLMLALDYRNPSSTCLSVLR